MIHCKHVHLSDVNKLSYLLTYLLTYHHHSPAVTNDVICLLSLHGKTKSQFMGTFPEVWFNAIFTFEIFTT